MRQVAVVLGLLVIVVALAVAAKRTGAPLPILLVVAGLVLGLSRAMFPDLPSIRLTPNVVFFVFLPPLLVSAAYDTSLGYFRANLLFILLLAIGLVLLTMAVVAGVAHVLFPALPLAAAFVLGAIVSPPDPVAGTAVIARLGLPHRLTTILEGEGLVNDVTALTAYRLAIAAVGTGSFSLLGAGAEFLRAGIGGAAVGLALGWITTSVLSRIDDAVLEIAITLIMPYATYLAAEQLGVSGVLAAVTAGFVLRGRVTQIGGASTRLQARAVWNTLVFLINGVVFVLIGFELGASISVGLPGGFLRAAAAVCGVVIAVRLAWMFVVPPLVRVAAQSLGQRAPAPPLPELAVLGWAGMRGVISLAAALAVPLRTADGSPFPGRAAIVLLTFAVIFATLVLQGLTLPAMARWLGVSDPEGAAHEEEEVRRAVAEAGAARVEQIARERTLPAEVVTELRRLYQRRLEQPESPAAEELASSYRRLACEALGAERAALMRLRATGKAGGDTAADLERNIDERELRLEEGEGG